MTVVASTTVAVAAASPGDFAVAAAAVNLEDVSGSRTRTAMVAREVGGGAVGACVGVLAGWRRGQLGHRKAVVAPMYSAGCGSESHVNIPNKNCLLYTSPSPRDKRQSRMPSSA